MTINVFGINMHEWFSEYCLLCGSKNHLCIDSTLAYGWECWNCFSRYFFAEEDKQAYMILYGKTIEEAEEDMNAGKVYLIGGQFQQGGYDD